MNAPAPASATSDFVWNDTYLLGYGPIDDEHREFVLSVHAIQTANDDQMLARLDAFAEHARDHFELENKLMVDTEFPARDCHIDEHAAVMKSVGQVREVVAAGDFDEGRRLAAELERWFPGHADYLDSALAQWMCKRSMGGKPVVVRRNILEATRTGEALPTRS
jgi:hemerythrin-like metal-binding protein